MHLDMRLSSCFLIYLVPPGTHGFKWINNGVIFDSLFQFHLGISHTMNLAKISYCFQAESTESHKHQDGGCFTIQVAQKIRYHIICFFSGNLSTTRQNVLQPHHTKTKTNKQTCLFLKTVK